MNNNMSTSFVHLHRTTDRRTKVSSYQCQSISLTILTGGLPVTRCDKLLFVQTPHIPNTASSYHCGIVLRSANPRTTAVDEYVNVAVRSKNSSGKNLLVHAIHNYNWSTRETIDDIDSKVAIFNNSVIALLDFYLPIHQVKRHSSDKPWITDQFRRLIRQRQYAWINGDRTEYNKLRNIINRLSKQ